MKFSINRLVLIVAACVLGLMAVDGLVRLNDEALTQYGVGESRWVSADSAMAMFLVGLAVGVVCGIAIFFAYLVLREKRLSAEPDDGIEALFEQLEREAEEEESDAEFFAEEGAPGECSEALDPWERPADWWRHSDES